VPQAAPTYFIAPTPAPAGPPGSAPAAAAAPSPLVSSTSLPKVAPPSPTPPCTDDLEYLQDLSIPDGTTVAPGELVDKRWQVRNVGTCNWDARYQLTLVGGSPMGVNTSLPLYPARAGSEATIRIVFIAPQDSGAYESQWQAVNPDGVAFGTAFYMQIVVAP